MKKNEARTADTSDKVGQLLQSTDIRFRPENFNSFGLVLVGDRVALAKLSDLNLENMGIAGLNEQFNDAFRHAFASRIWPSNVIRQEEICHVRGVLLCGPQGCGKTTIAVQLGKLLNAHYPSIVQGYMLNHYVQERGEGHIHELFYQAEKEQLESGDHSRLHIILITEIDELVQPDRTRVSDLVVDLLFRKINSLNNVLLIGTTNRRDMVDDALLRLGRLELVFEIVLPDTNGRLAILKHHTQGMRNNSRVTQELVERLPELAERCKNFTGAELEGLVKGASSYALSRCFNGEDFATIKYCVFERGIQDLVVEYSDFERALQDARPRHSSHPEQTKLYKTTAQLYSRL